MGFPIILPTEQLMKIWTPYHSFAKLLKIKTNNLQKEASDPIVVVQPKVEAKILKMNTNVACNATTTTTTTTTICPSTI